MKIHIKLNFFIKSRTWWKDYSGKSIELTPKYGIKINTVSPSMTLTPFEKKSYTENEIKETANENLSKWLGEVEDTVNAVLFLLREKAEVALYPLLLFSALKLNIQVIIYQKLSYYL